MAPPPFKGKRTQNFGANATWAITKPTVATDGFELADGDTVVLWATSDSDHDILTDPSGFTPHGTMLDTSSDSSTSLWTKHIASAAGEPAWAIVLSGLETGTVAMQVYSGAAATGAIDPAPVLVNGTTSTATPSTGSYTPANDDSTVIAIFGTDPAGAVTGTPNGSFVERVEWTNGTSAFVYGMDWAQTTATAATGGPTFSAADRYNRAILSLKAAPAPPSGPPVGGLLSLGVGG